MTALVIAVSIIAGITCIEFMNRTLRPGSWLRERLRRSMDLLAQFNGAAGDDERQRALIRAGASTLMLSLAFLAWLAVVSALFLVPGALLGRDVPFTSLYLGGACVASLGWWALRSRRDAR